MALTKTEIELLSQVAKKATVLKTASEKTLRKKEFIKEAVSINPKAIKYAAKEILDDSVFLYKLVSENGMVAAYIPVKYTNVQIFLKAIENTLEIEPYVPKQIYRAMADGRGIIQETPYILCGALSETYHYYTPDLIKNKNVALFITKHFQAGFHQRVAEKYNGDRDIAMLAISVSIYNFNNLDKTLQNDIEILKHAYRKDPSMFMEEHPNSLVRSQSPVDLLAPHRSEVVKDRDFIEECLYNGSYILEPEYADDEEMAILAITNTYNSPAYFRDYNRSNYKVLSDRLKDDEDFMLHATMIDVEAIMYASNRLKTDKDYTLHLIQELSERVPDLKAGEIEDFVLLKYLSDDMKDDEEIVAACVVENPAEFEHASNRLQHDSNYVVNLMMTYDLDLTDYLSEEVLSDKQVVVYLKTQDFKKRFRL